jgi:carbohydrate-selective porin OprB
MAIIRKLSVLLFLAVTLAGLSTIAIGQSSDSTSATKDKTYNLATSKYLFGDWGGARTKAEEKGVTFDFFYVSDLLDNVKGGRQKAAGWNRVRGTMDIDFGRLGGPKGLSFHITGLWQGGVNLGGGTSPHGGAYLGSIANPSGLVSANTTRLDSFWLQQSLFDGKLTVRAGQFAGMDFYGVQYYGGNYLMEPLDYAFGNLGTTHESFDPAAGPAVEVKIAPVKNFYYKTAVMSANWDPYGQDDNGFHFKLQDHHTGAWLNEVGFLVDQPKTGTDAKPKYYPGLYKVGAAYNPDAYFVDLVSNTYSPRNYLVYFMANQAVYRPEAGSNKGLDVHFGMDFSPEAVNTIDRQITGGLIYNGLIPKRSKDAVAFGFVYSHVSEKANIASTLNGFPALGSEKAFEINYLTQVTPWLQWQPVVQIYNDLGGSSIRGNGVVLGFRTKVTF